MQTYSSHCLNAKIAVYRVYAIYVLVNQSLSQTFSYCHLLKYMEHIDNGWCRFFSFRNEILDIFVESDNSSIAGLKSAVKKNQLF